MRARPAAPPRRRSPPRSAPRAPWQGQAPADHRRLLTHRPCHSGPYRLLQLQRTPCRVSHSRPVGCRLTSRRRLGARPQTRGRPPVAALLHGERAARMCCWQTHRAPGSPPPAPCPHGTPRRGPQQPALGFPRPMGPLGYRVETPTPPEALSAAWRDPGLRAGPPPHDSSWTDQGRGGAARGRARPAAARPRQRPPRPGPPSARGRRAAARGWARRTAALTRSPPSASAAAAPPPSPTCTPLPPAKTYHVLGQDLS